MQHGPPRRRRARPVADAPIDALLVAVEDLAKGWLLALLEQAPLEAAPGILAADLSRDGPRICDAVVRAIADDADLRRIEPGGALEPLVSRAAELAGADSPEARARAVDALQAVIWSALRAEMPWPDPEQVSDVAERLGLISELVRAAVLRYPGRRATIDEAEDRPAPALRVTRASEPDQTPSGSDTVVRSDIAFGRSGPTAASAEPSPSALWVGAIEDEIVQSERSGASLSLLLAELDDGDRVRAVETGSEGSATFGRFAQAVRSVVRREDILACETDSRAWIIARETGRGGANALALRIARAVEDAPPWRGAPMTVSVGLAVLGQDGRDASGLIEAAEEAKFAAEATGVRVMPDDPAGRGGSPLAS